MPKRFVVEMFCDRVAASKIYMKENYNDASPLGYFEKSKKTRFINQETSDEIEFLLTKLSKDGEKATFAYIKDLIKHDKPIIQ